MLFVAINFISGIVALLFGTAASLNFSHSSTAALVGLVTLGLAATCLWLAKGFISAKPNQLQ